MWTTSSTGQHYPDPEPRRAPQRTEPVRTQYVVTSSSRTPAVPHYHVRQKESSSPILPIIMLVVGGFAYLCTGGQTEEPVAKALQPGVTQTTVKKAKKKPVTAPVVATAPAMVEIPPADAKEYIAKYAPIAVVEMRKYGVPASITLAQGLLESQAGSSQLALRAANHFGIKCFSRGCSSGHCMNFTDDTHKDFFKIYNSAWASYRDHSQFVTSGRYAELKRCGNDYQAWARGLKRLGYATAPDYATSLIAFIRKYQLDRYDQ